MKNRPRERIERKCAGSAQPCARSAQQNEHTRRAPGERNLPASPLTGLTRPLLRYTDADGQRHEVGPM